MRRTALVSLLALLTQAGVAGGQALAADWSPRDSAIFEQKLAWARRARLDTMPIGQAVAAVGLTFVGTPYAAATLEQPGQERLVVNLHGLDCVTFVETVLALTWLAREAPALLTDPLRARARYEALLRELRYRGGTIDGYPSRLHYFTEWLAQGQARGRWRLVTAELGGVPLWQEVNFMSTHRSAYPALADSQAAAAIEAVERRLTDAGPMVFLPKGWIDAAVTARVQTGDIIAATSARVGLDVVHTGFAIQKDGEAWLLHAPLAGGHVELAARPLGERLQRLRAQTGIIVARPLDPTTATGAPAPAAQ